MADSGTASGTEVLTFEVYYSRAVTAKAGAGVNLVSVAYGLGDLDTFLFPKARVP